MFPKNFNLIVKFKEFFVKVHAVLKQEIIFGSILKLRNVRNRVILVLVRQ